MAKPSHIRWKWGQIRFLYFWACYKLFQMNLAGFIWIVTSIKNSTLPKRMNVPLVSQLTMSSIVGSGKPFISFNYLTYSTNKGCKRCVSGKRTSTSMALENKRRHCDCPDHWRIWKTFCVQSMAIWPRWQGCNQPTINMWMQSECAVDQPK